MRTKRLAWAAALGSILALWACDLNFLSSDSVARAKDAIGPVIVIDSPAEGSECANIVEIRGSVSDASDEKGSAGRVSSLAYSVPGFELSGSVAVDDDGVFTLQLATSGLGSNFSLSLSALDWNGNQSKTSLNLCKRSGNNLPSFSAVADNKRVSLSWDPVPNTDSYTLYYTDNGALPSATVGSTLEEVSSPLEISCQNGKLYTFLLVANAQEGWDDSLSDYLCKIPLSERTLVPRAYGKRGKILLKWNQIDATDQFTVYRRVGESGTFNQFRTVSGTSLSDDTVSNGTRYYYKVMPAEGADVLSGPSGAESDGFNVSYAVTKSSVLSDTGTIDIFKFGDTLYGAGPKTGFCAFDAQKPLSPALKARILPKGGTASQCVALGQYAYLSAGADGLLVYDVSAPENPKLKGSYSAGIDNAMGLCLNDGQVILVDLVMTQNADYTFVYTCSLLVIDVSTPSAPSLVSRIILDDAVQYDEGLMGSFADLPVEVAVKDGYAFVAERGAGLRVVDLSAGTAITIRPSSAGTDITSNLYGLVINGDYAYLGADNYGIWVLDISDPGAPTQVSLDAYGANGRVYGLDISGSWLAAASLDIGVLVYRLDDPGKPIRYKAIPLPYAFQICLNGLVAYACSIDDNYFFIQSVVDLNIPLGLKECGLLATESQGSIVSGNTEDFGACPSDVVVEGSYAYYADGSGGLRIFNVSNPEDPVETSSIHVDGGYFNRVKVSGGLAYVGVSAPIYSGSGNFNYINIYDISDPSAPTLLSSTLCAYCRGFDVSGGYLYVTDYYNGLEIFDVDDPSAPTMVRAIDASACINGVAILGSYALVADETLGTVFFDIADPLSACDVDCLSMSDGENLCATDSVLLSANTYSGYAVADLTDPANPVVKLSANGSTLNCRGVCATGNYAFLYGKRDGVAILRIVDIARASNPSLVCELNLGKANGILTYNGLAVSGGYLYAVDDLGLHVYGLRP